MATYSFRDPERGRLTVVSRDVIPSGWRVYAAIPQSEILSGARSLGVFLVVTVVSTTLIGALLYSFVAKIVTDPLRQLTEKMEAIPSRHEDVEFNIRSNDEIGRLNDGIAGLVSRMIALMDRISAEEEAKRDAQISALTAQIKPHFLYNTLNTVKHLYGLGEAERASTMLSALSDYFRYTMEEWKTPATVGREVEHAESFLLIARTRLGDPVEYYIDVDIDIINEPVMRITLQPLVENALKHGTPEPPQKTRIGILGKRDTTRQSIVLSVLDNGPGVPQPSLRRLNGATDGTDTHEFGVGLANLRERLSAYYSSRASLEVINRSAGGTEVRITTPINISKRDG